MAFRSMTSNMPITQNIRWLNFKLWWYSWMVRTLFPPEAFLYLLILASESKQMNSSYFIKVLIFRQISLPISKILLPLHRKTLLSLPYGILQGYCFFIPLLVRRKCFPQNYLYFSINRKNSIRKLRVAGCVFEFPDTDLHM